MKEKDLYTFEELCSNLKMPMSKFCQQAGITEGTIARLRKGYPARRGTINVLLDTFSQVYGLEFSLENVSGLTPVEKTVIPVVEKAIEPPVNALPFSDTTTSARPQKRTVERKEKAEFALPDDLPEGTMKLADFCRQHGVADSTFSRWIDKTKGIKGGDWIEVVTRNKASGMGVQHFLTPDQQERALKKMRQYGKLKETE
jgi:hypothetical protein